MAKISVLKYFLTFLIFLDNNISLAPYFEITEKFFNQKVRELVLQYNYTYNQEGVYQAIRYMYTYHPDPHNTTHIREQFIHVSVFQIMSLCIAIKIFIIWK